MKRSRHTSPPRRVVAWAVVSKFGSYEDRLFNSETSAKYEREYRNKQYSWDGPFRIVRLTGNLPVKRGNKGRKGS